MNEKIGESYIKAIENFDCLEKISQKLDELQKKNLEYVKEYKTAEARETSYCIKVLREIVGGI